MPQLHLLPYGPAAQQATQDYALAASFLRIITTPAIPRPSRNRGICRFYSGEKAPEGEFRSLERPGSLQYHAPSPLPVGLRFRPKPERGDRGSGTALRAGRAFTRQGCADHS